MRRSSEWRLVGWGVLGLGAIAVLFAAGKVAFWRSVVVHEEAASVHRLFPGGWVVRFPQEAFSVADFLTGTFLIAAGLLSLVIAFAIGERLRAGRVASPSDAGAVRTFFGLAAAGFVWLGLDEIFLLHELLSANFYVPDAGILACYAAAGVAAAVWWQRVLRTSGLALGVLAIGASLHGAALAMDFLQDVSGWTPEEPTEMLAAGFYALAIATYAARLLLPAPAAARASAPDPSTPPEFRAHAHVPSPR